MTGEAPRSLGTKSINLISDPRSLAPAADGSIICIGLRDGSVAALAADWDEGEMPAPVILRAPRTDGEWQEAVRAICNVTRRWWVVARSNGVFDWLRIEPTSSPKGLDTASERLAAKWKAGVKPTAPRYELEGFRATHISVLDPVEKATEGSPLHLIVSYARVEQRTNEHCTVILRVTFPNGAKKAPRMEYVQSPMLFGRLRSAVRITQPGEVKARWLLVGYTGSCHLLDWQHNGEFVAQDLTVIWPGGATDVVTSGGDWNPALVNDVTAVRGRRKKTQSDTDNTLHAASDELVLGTEVVLSTDIGAFVMRIGTKDEKLQGDVQRLDHAGLRGVPLAVACTASTQHKATIAYVWCYDSLSGVHMYEGQLNNQAWNRIHSQGRDTPAVLAIAFQTPLKRLVVWQNCRDESIAVTRYEFRAASKEHSVESIQSIDSLNALTSIEDARTWLAGKYPAIEVPKLEDAGSLSPAKAPEWVLAELFDPSPQHANKVWEFLADPKFHLATDAITKICEDVSDPALRANRIRESIDLWAQTLVGSILRHDPPFRDDLALGVVRWLHRLSKWASSDDAKLSSSLALREGAPSAARASDDAVFDVRRWTLFAPPSSKAQAGVSVRSPQRRLNRPGLAYQLSRLGPLVQRVDATRSQLEEAVVKEFVLFNRRIDDEAQMPQDEADAPEISDGIPYHVAQLDLPDGSELCAVVFRQSCIRLYKVDVAPDIQPDESAIAPRRLRDSGEIPIPKKMSRFGRAACLWSDGGRQFLLTTVHSGTTETMALWDVTTTTPTRLSRWQDENLAGLHENVMTSLHVIPPPRPVPTAQSAPLGALVLMGLRCHSGDATLYVRHVHPQFDANGKPKPTELTHTPYTLVDAHNTMIPNPVHCVQYVDGSDRRRVVAGCDDGTIWLLDDIGKGTTPKKDPTQILVARLAAPVWKVHCRELDDKRLRVYAGTADGHIFAWEQLKSEQEGSASNRPSESPELSFACLWSTHEGRGIVSLSSQQTTLDGQKTSAILAVSRNGRAVLLADHGRVETRGSELEIEDRHTWRGRPRVPGERLERFDLQTTAFAAAALEAPSSRGASSLAPIARLLVVTAESVVRVVALHQPKRSEPRKKTYGKVGVLWHRSLRPARNTKVDEHRLRYTEALRSLAPGIWLLPVRFFTTASLSKDLHEVRASLRSIHVEWFPRHLRRFVCSAHELAAIALALRESTNIGIRAIERHCDHLRQALRDARELRDKKLFQEMMLTVERSVNEVLLDVCTSESTDDERDKLMYQLYNDVHEVLQQECRPWLTTDVETYAHVQAVRIKNMVDGRCILHLTILARSGKREPLRKIILVRVRHIQTLLREANPLIPLETLAAINISLLSAAWMQVDSDPAWSRHRTFIDVIGTFASQASTHAGDALAHEIARVHALCLILAPHEATRVAMSMKSGELPEQLLNETQLQLRLLPQLLTNTRFGKTSELAVYRAQARTWFEHCLRNPPVQSHTDQGGVERAPASPSKAQNATDVARTFEAEKAAWAAAYEPIWKTVGALKNATKHLANAPQSVSFRAIAELTQALAAKKDPKQEPKAARAASDREAKSPLSDEELYFAQHFYKDVEYFVEHLGKFTKICEAHEIPIRTNQPVKRKPPQNAQPKRSDNNKHEAEAEDDELPVAPAILLASPQFHQWALDAKDALRRTHIPEPRNRYYKRALDQFADVTLNIRESSAVQRRLVTGVLGHHLLEALEEHVLSVAEMAHVLYPRRLLEGLNSGAHQSSLGQHAEALSAQAEHARAIPKNLRALFQLLHSESSHKNNDGEIEVAEIFTRAFKAERLPKSALKGARRPTNNIDATGAIGKVPIAVAASLGLVFAELASNYRVHGGCSHSATLKGGAESSPRRYEIVLGVPDTLSVLDESSKTISSGQKRLVEVASGRFQAFAPPHADIEESSGVGLYIANLAASIVGWKISLQGQEKARDCFTAGQNPSDESYMTALRALVPTNSLTFVLSEHS